jgi:hypothetical protein
VLHHRDVVAGGSGGSRLPTYQKSESVVRREIADETILVPIRGELASLQQVFVLNPVAAFVWERLDGSTDTEAILAGILERFEVSHEEAGKDLQELVEAFEAVGLITRSPAEP